MQDVWKLGGLRLVELGKRTVSEVMEDNVPDRAAGLAYYFLFSLFPALFFLVTILGFLAEPGGRMMQSLLGYLGDLMPGSASDLVRRTLTEINRSASGWKLVFGVVTALWAASNAILAIMAGINIAYDVKEDRPWWKTRLLAVLLTLAFSAFTIIALGLLLFGGPIGALLTGPLGLGGIFLTVWNILQWPIMIFFVLLAFAIVYRYAPSLEGLKWQWITPGSVVGVALWLLVSFGFRVYLSFFDSYNEVYGSLGALMILLLWFWLSGTAILVGAEVNSEIEHSAAERGAPDARRPGEKRPRQLRAA